MAVDDIALSLNEVHSGYGEVKVLKGVSVSVLRGTITCVLGANGAGKSTLLKTVFGILRATQGEIEFEGKNLVGLKPTETLKLGISYVPQGRCNFPGMTVRENLEMGAYSRRDKNISIDIDKIIQRFEVLGQKSKEMAGNLSGGQQQILEMAMALLLEPKLLLVDEPSLGLSPIMTDQVLEAIRYINADGTTVIMVEQNAKRALETSDYAFVLELGCNWLDGPAEEILANPQVRLHYLGL